MWFKPKGFTLLEILIAVFIFTIVSALIAMALHSVFTAENSTEKHATRLADLQMALLFITRDLEQAINRPVRNAADSQEPAFVGQAHSLTLTHGGFTNPDSLLQRSTLQRTHYFVSQNLLMRETHPALDQTSADNAHYRSLLNTVMQCDFRYFDKDNRAYNSWPPPHQTVSALPHAVSISLALRQWGQVRQIYVVG